MESLFADLPARPNAARAAPEVMVDAPELHGSSTAVSVSHLPKVDSLVAPSECLPAPYLAHPETGEVLLLPRGYSVRFGTLWFTKTNKEVVPVYSGELYVRATGTNVSRGERTLEVTFDGQGGRQTVQVPREKLANPSGVIHQLARRGAYITTDNASRVVRYLGLFEALNRAILPERKVSDRLGLLPGGVLMTPSGSVGGEVTYIGPDLEGLRPGPDDQAYLRVLREAAGWENAAPLWWLIGLCLASPALKRLRPRRYPVTYLAGDSGTGKTTTAFFALGVWAAPGQEPFTAQGIRTTQVAFAQTLERLGGLPYLIDEAHASEKPRDLENTVYTFANGQSYGRAGARDGVAGGCALGGAVLLVGEARPEFEHAGSHNRLLLIGADTHPPLGQAAQRGSVIGAQRAGQLERAWEAGAGHLGPAVCRPIWADWPAFEARVGRWQADPASAALKDWQHATAIVMATLDVLFDEVLHIPVPADVQALPGTVAGWLQRHRDTTRPSDEAFEQLRTLFVQGRTVETARGQTLHLGGEFVGWCQGGQWFLLSGSKAVQSRVGKQGIQLHGRRWAEQGWIVADARQGSTRAAYCPMRGGTVRVLVIPQAALEGVPPAPGS